MNATIYLTCLNILFALSSFVIINNTSFQFKLVMRILTTNRFLRLINCRDDDRCTFFAAAPRRYHTYFWNAGLFKDTGMIFRDTWKEMVLNEFCKRTRLFGDNRKTLMTHIVTLAKVVTYDARYSEIQPSFTQFRAYLKRDFEQKALLRQRKIRLTASTKSG